jgi:hypothetical protein
MLQKVGCHSAETFLAYTLLAGEILQLMNSILQISGFSNPDELLKQAKN